MGHGHAAYGTPVRVLVHAARRGAGGRGVAAIIYVRDRLNNGGSNYYRSTSLHYPVPPLACQQRGAAPYLLQASSTVLVLVATCAGVPPIIQSLQERRRAASAARCISPPRVTPSQAPVTPAAPARPDLSPASGYRHPYFPLFAPLALLVDVNLAQDRFCRSTANSESRPPCLSKL